MGHILGDNRHGLIASVAVAIAEGYAEREAAQVMITDAKQVADEKAQITMADKGHHAAELIEALTDMKVQTTWRRTPAIASQRCLGTLRLSKATSSRRKRAISSSKDLAGLSSLARFVR